MHIFSFGFIGNLKPNFAQCPNSDSAHTFPSCCSNMRLIRKSPSPEPRLFNVFLFFNRENLPNNLLFSSSLKPGP